MTKDKNDDFKKIIKKLESVGFLEKNIGYIEKKIKMIDHELTKVKITRLKERKGGGNEYRIEKLLDEKSQLTNKLNDLKLEKKFIIEAVNSLDVNEREIIIDFYFKNLNISKIAKKFLYSEIHVRRLKSSAIVALERILN